MSPFWRRRRLWFQVDGGFVGGGAFGKNTRLLGVRPTLLVLPAKPSPAARGGGGALGYCVGQSVAAAASGRDRNAARGVGVGGSPQTPRLALDDMFETLTLRRCALAKVKVRRVRVNGLGQRLGFSFRVRARWTAPLLSLRSSCGDPPP